MLLFALSIAVLVLVGAGVAVMQATGLRRRLLVVDGATFGQPFIYFGTGLLANLFLNLIIGRLSTALIATAALGGLGLLLSCLLRDPLSLRRLPRALVRLLLALTLSLGALSFLRPILAEPLRAWDARSVWFFHAKLIYYNGGLNRDAGWTNPAFQFSHVDYPKLVPVLAAETAELAGYWNEFLPKTSLFFVLLAAFLAMGAFLKSPFSCAVLFGGALLAVSSGFTTGYMDAYLTVFFGLSLAFWGRWLQAGSIADGVSGSVCLGIASSLKAEGMLAGLSIAIAIAPVLLWRIRSVRPSVQELKPIVIALCVGFAPIAAWTIIAHQLGLKGWLQPGSDTMARVHGRLLEFWAGDTRILRSLVLESPVLPALRVFGATALFAALGSLVFRENILRAAYLPLAATLIYLLGLFATYLATPYDLGWHLGTSADRTSLAPAIGFVVATSALIAAFERTRFRQP